MPEIDTDWNGLMRQSKATADEYFDNAVLCIDRKFGEGYAAKNPQLIAAFMQVTAADFHSMALAVASQNIRNGLQDVAEATGGES